MAIAERDLPIPTPDAEEDYRPQPYRWTREHFYRMGDMSLFEGQRVILIEGEILAMPAMKEPHRTTITLASETLRAAFGDGFFVSVQCPFDIGEATDPEPDIAIIRGKVRDYVGRGLTRAELIVEVSDTTLAYDRRDKALLYAQAGVTDYWIINLKAMQIEAYRDPLPPEQVFGLGYKDVQMYRVGQAITPVALPAVSVAVADLLP